jgi:hypothetical protein
MIVLLAIILIPKLRDEHFFFALCADIVIEITMGLYIIDLSMRLNIL